MSGAGKKRGKQQRGGGDPARSQSERTSGREIAGQAGQYDGPPSRGGSIPIVGSRGGRSTSGAGSAASHPQSNAPSASVGDRSQVGSPGSSPKPSQTEFSGTGPASRPTSSHGPFPTAPSSGLDPALDPGRRERPTDALRNVDLPAVAFNFDREYGVATSFQARPGYNNTGQPVKVQVNSYEVANFPTKPIYQYDVNIGNGAEKRVVINKVWNSRAVRSALGNATFLFDGNKLAWSMHDFPVEKRATVDLDQEFGRRPGKTANTFRVAIRKTKKLDTHVIEYFLRGQVAFSNQVLEAVNFLDHLLRETPSNSPNFVAVKRQFFTRTAPKAAFRGGVEVLRGIYQSLRLADGAKTIINLDVANCCFWTPQSLLAAMMARHNANDAMGLIFKLRAVMKTIHGEEMKEESPDFKVMARNFKKLVVVARFQNQKPGMEQREWTIKGFLNMNAQEYLLEVRNKQTGQVESSQTLFDYFEQKYQLRLRHWQLPLVEMTKKGTVYPIELLHLQPHQRWLTKLDDKQTADMIKFAVSRPQQRMKATEDGKNALNWAGDPILREFGLQIAPNMMKIDARLLKNPKIQFGGTQIDPGVSGRWDLRNKKFVKGNPEGLKSWGVGVQMPKAGTVDRGLVDNFITSFVRAYQQHGGTVLSPRPFMQQFGDNTGAAVENLYTGTGNAFKTRPQLLVFLVQGKDAFNYMRIKRSCDCRYGIVSQVMQYAQCIRNNPQYISNVLMKVNAKLGGATSQAVAHPTSGSKAFSKPTMIIGADVSHASPGSLAPSTAAITVSLDRYGGRYAAAVETNGQRVEMITENNFRDMLAPLSRHWASTVGQGRNPQHVYYFRDGVSEGQYQHVMQQEVPRIRAIFSDIEGEGATWKGTLTVVICSKRHHIRAYPEQRASDRNGNPQPGLLIERGVTSPHEWDFYLYSHIALQGTSRPVHYTILQDQANHGPNQIQNMIYEHCYHYMRSTTSVSLFPAVYYAHLASNRAKAHEDTPLSDPRKAGLYKQNVKQLEDEPPPSEVPKLIPMHNQALIRYSMWYI